MFLTKFLCPTTVWILFGFGILGLVLGVSATVFFIIFKKNKQKEKDTFKVTTGKYKIFRFWQYYGIIILALTGYIMALIFLGICIGEII